MGSQLSSMAHSSVFKRYAFSSLISVFIYCLCCLFLANSIIVRVQKDAYEQNLINQGNAALADIEEQLDILNDTALKISVSSEFSPNFWHQNPYYEINLKNSLTRYTNVVPISHEIGIWWKTWPDTMFSASEMSSGKNLCMAYFGQKYDSVDAANVLDELKHCSEATVICMPAKYDEIIILIPVSTGVKNKSENQAVIMFPLHASSLTNRIQLITANKKDAFTLFWRGDTSKPITFNGEDVDYEKAWTLFSENFSLNIKTSYPIFMTGNIVPMPHVFFTILIVFSIITIFIAYRNWLPLYRLSQQYKTNISSENEIHIIENALENAYQEIRRIDIRSQDQLLAIRNDILILILNGVNTKEIRQHYWLLSDLEKYSYFRVINLKTEAEHPHSIANEFEALSSESVAVFFCHWDSLHGDNILLCSYSMESLYETEMMIYDLMCMNNAAFSISKGTICSSVYQVHQSYLSAITKNDKSENERNESSQPDPTEKIDIIVAFINEHILDSESNLNQLADHFGMNVSYLSGLLKNRLGMNYKTYVSRQRNEKAKELLTNTDMTLSEICLHIGYSDKSYFIRIFKELNGMTPGEFRAVTHDNTSDFA